MPLNPGLDPPNLITIISLNRYKNVLDFWQLFLYKPHRQELGLTAFTIQTTKTQ